MTFNRRYFLLFITCVVILSCSKKTELVWEQALFQIGSQSSPRCTDLNGDGILDVVMGAGKGEMASCDHGILAVDGSNGQLLWHAEASAQVVGSATFIDINADTVDDIIIGGRGHVLKAVNGKDGAIIWSYEYQYEDHPVLQYARFNFYNSVRVPDQNDDQIEELLLINGGNWDAAPDSSIDRYPGVLMLINPVTGSILAADTMPDGQESYMSPLCLTTSTGGDPNLIFGTGGETLSGNLYRCKLSDLIAAQLSDAIVLASEQGHGFIAPPSLADLNEDGYSDIVAVSHAGNIWTIDGQTNQKIWEKAYPGYEVSSSPAIGQFNDDAVPDAIFLLSNGVWPNYSVSRQVVLDGTDGSVIYDDSLGCFSLASAVVYDLNRDGIDEAILSLNQYDCDFTLSEDTLSPPTIETQLIAIDIRQKTVKIIENKDRFRNIFSTPWIGDLDADGYLDIIYSQYFNHSDIRKYRGMNIKRISTHIRCKREPKWGAYMGSGGDGIYHK